MMDTVLPVLPPTRMMSFSTHDRLHAREVNGVNIRAWKGCRQIPDEATGYGVGKLFGNRYPPRTAKVISGEREVGVGDLLSYRSCHSVEDRVVSDVTCGREETTGECDSGFSRRASEGKRKDIDPRRCEG